MPEPRLPVLLPPTAGRAQLWLAIYIALVLALSSLVVLELHDLVWTWRTYLLFALLLVLAPIIPYHTWRQRRRRERLQRGFYLLREQDFATRLTPIGAPDVDLIVEVFNALLSQLKEHKVRLGEQGVLLSRLIEAMPMGIVIGDFDGRVTQINPAARQLLRIDSLDSARGMPLSDLVARWNPNATELAFGQKRTLRDGTANAYRISLLDFRDRGFARPYIQIESLTETLRESERATYSKLIRLLSH